MGASDRLSRAGVCFAVTDDGVELPVVDITNPAFDVGVEPGALSTLADESLESMRQFLSLPGFVRGFVTRRSVILGKASGSDAFLSGMSTYINKLGPDWLPEACTDFDRRSSRMVGAVAIRMRLRQVARSIADRLIASLSVSDSTEVHVLSLSGGTASDALNALILVQAERPELLNAREVVVHVLDPDEAGPRFAGRCLEALTTMDAPLDGVAVTLQRSPYDWSDPKTLRAGLARMDLAGTVVQGSSEGGLFEYGSDVDIVANLAVLRDGTPDDFGIVGTLWRDEPLTRVMRETNPLEFTLRKVEPFAELVRTAGWEVDTQADDNPVYHVVGLRKR
jgi:hypothetical protein